MVKTNTLLAYVSVFNPIFFYQHLTMNHPHHSPSGLRHPEEESMPPTIKFLAQAVALQTPGELVTPSQTNLNMKGTKNFSSTPSSPMSCPYTTSST